jgi:hypothetical protein
MLVPNPGVYCGITFPSANIYDVSSVRSAHASGYAAWRTSADGKAYLDRYDPARGFDHSAHVYRGLVSPGAAYSTGLVRGVSRSLHFFNASTGTMNLRMTSLPVNDPSYVAEVYLLKESFTAGQRRTSLSFAISVQSK